MSFALTHVYYVGEVETYLDDLNPMTVMVTKLEGSTIILASLMLAYVSLVCRKSQIVLIDRILKIESEIFKMSFSRLQYNDKLMRKTNAEVAINVIFWIFFFPVYCFTLPRDFFIAYLIETVQYIFYDFFIICVTQFLRNIIITIGNLFYELCHNLKSHILRDTLDFDCEDVKLIFRIYNDLSECIEVFNESFGIQFLAIFIFMFGIGTFEAYFAFSSLALMPSEHLDIKIVVGLIGNLICYVPIVMLIFEIGHSCIVVKEAVIKVNEIESL